MIMANFYAGGAAGFFYHFVAVKFSKTRNLMPYLLLSRGSAGVKRKRLFFDKRVVNVM